MFVSSGQFESAIQEIRICAQDEQFDILGYCVMPDHVHLVVEGRTESSDLKRFAKMAKQRSGAQFARTARRPLWQEGYFDRVLRESDDIRGVVRYILENPIRAGIAERVEDYPYLGSDKWTPAEILDALQT